MRSFELAFAFVSLLLVACGGETPPPASPANAANDRAATTPGPSAAAEPENMRASTVRFDDLGISFTVPPGYRVLGDEELAARIRATADLRLNRSLRDRAAQRKGLPLLSLEKQTADANDFLTISLSVVLVPQDARAMELAAQQQGVMAEHLAGFQVTDPPKGKTVSNVEGAELAMRYQVKRGGEARRAASTMRVFVRDGLATIAVAVWPEESAPRGEEARLVLDGLSFYSPAGA